MAAGQFGELSELQKLRSRYAPELPPALQGDEVEVVLGDATTASDPSDAHAIARAFPLTYGQPLAHLVAAAGGGGSSKKEERKAVRVGVVFCGRQSPGGHNVVAGLLDAAKKHHPDSEVLGFVEGTEGLFAQKTVRVTAALLAPYRNQGGYDLLCRTRDQIRSVQQVEAAKVACAALRLDGLVLVGGCGTHTDAAQLAETLAAAGSESKVVGVPVAIDGDLKNQFVEADVGFDTACKVYSALISNVCTDAVSAEKYYYFIRVMGRRSSLVSLECALQSHPNVVVLSEEVAAAKMTLLDVTAHICDAIQARAARGKHHGVVLLPEGLIESIPECYALLQELHELVVKRGVPSASVPSALSPWAAALFAFLPPFIQTQLLLDRESDGAVQLSQIETEKLLAQLVDTEMAKRGASAGSAGTTGKKLNAICHFFGYQARGSLPSNFDCDYAYALGHTALHLVAAGLNGYMATVSNLKEPVAQWRPGAAPISAMMSVKRWLRRGPGGTAEAQAQAQQQQLGKPAVHPAQVDLRGKPYKLLLHHGHSWLLDDLYRNPGPIQFQGPGADLRTVSLAIEEQDYMGRIQQLTSYLDKVKSIVKPGCPEEVLKAALSSMASITEVLSVMSAPTYFGMRNV